MLRAAVKAGTPVGRKAKAVMDSGALVSDDIVVGIVADRIEEADAKRGFILDGFPRTIGQAEALDGLLRKLGRDAIRVIAIEVPRSELLNRLGGRVSCPKDGAS